jgi:hypothetical protein
MEDLLELSRALFEKGASVRFQAKGWSRRPFIYESGFLGDEN